MKADKRSIARALDRPEPGTRFYLFHGSGEGQSRALAEQLLRSLGAAKVALPAGSVRADPAMLADEAGAISLFDGPRALWIEPAGDEIAAGAEALLAAPAVESPVIAVAGVLRKTSALLKLAESHPHALAYVSYMPEGRDAERMVVDVGRTFGLRVADTLAARIADAAGNDQAIVTQELAKLALYLDAAPESPKELDSEAVDAVGAAMPEGDFQRLADLALAGDLRGLAGALAGLDDKQAIPVVRALQRRLLMLAPVRARVEAGERLDAVLTSLGKSLFWKDKPFVQKASATWDSAGLARVAERLGRLERELMLSQAPDREALGEELVAIARATRGRR